MRRMLALLLVLLLLTACAASQKEMEQPVKFYYCYRDAQTGKYGGETGALSWELFDLGQKPLTAEEILHRYLQGPKDPGLQLPMPEGTTVERVSLQSGVLSVDLSEEAQQLAGVDRTLAVACLVQTMIQFADIDSVVLQSGGRALWDGPLTMESFLLLDDTATSDAVTVKLYFGDSDSRYLREETRSVTFQSEDEIPAYILQQLLEGPLSGEYRTLLPEGTRVLDVQSEDGICTVNFSESFLWYQPSTNLEARQAVLSVVNALTELPEVACVRFLCGDDPVSYYVGLDLSEPIYRDETAFGAGSQQEGATDVTLYMPCGNRERLAAVPLVLNRTSGRGLESDVLQSLLSAETINSYENPFPEGTMVLGTETRNGLCTVTFNAAFTMCDLDSVQARKAVRSVVATLCALERVDRVSIEIQNGKLTSVDLSEPMSPEAAWFLP